MVHRFITCGLLCKTVDVQVIIEKVEKIVEAQLQFSYQVVDVQSQRRVPRIQKEVQKI